MMLEQCERRIAKATRVEGTIRAMPLRIVQEPASMPEKQVEEKAVPLARTRNGSKREAPALRGGIDGKTCAIVLAPDVHAALVARAERNGTSVKAEVLRAVLVSL
jgi:hypothetical protein